METNGHNFTIPTSNLKHFLFCFPVVYGFSRVATYYSQELQRIFDISKLKGYILHEIKHILHVIDKLKSVWMS